MLVDFQSKTVSIAESIGHCVNGDASGVRVMGGARRGVMSCCC